MNCKTKLFFILLTLIFFNLQAEKIHLSIRYLGLKVVNIMMEDSENKISIYGQSTSLANIAAKLDNRYFVEYDSDYLPIKYSKKIAQKNYFEDRITYYNREKSYAEMISFLDSSKSCEYEIKPSTRDFFSGLYYLRNQEKSGEMWVDANQIIWKITYEFIGKETVNCAIGKVDARIVKITCKKYSDEKPKRSDMLTNNLVNEKNALYFWFTDDEQSIPVKAKYSMKPFPVIWKIESYEK